MQGKVAVITGGAHGIGRAIADAFRRKGAEVHIIDIQPGDWFVGDVSKKEDLDRFAASVIEKSGNVDYLINNALPQMKGIDDCTWEEFSYALAVSLAGKARVNSISPGWIDTTGSVITGENICIDGGMTKLMIYHGEHGWEYSG